MSMSATALATSRPSGTEPAKYPARKASVALGATSIPRAPRGSATARRARSFLLLASQDELPLEISRERNQGITYGIEDVGVDHGTEVHSDYAWLPAAVIPLALQEPS